MSSFLEAYERIKFATHTKTQVELAQVLDIRQSSISDAKRRNSVPSDWVMKLFEKFGLNPDWIKQGIGPMYLRTEQGYEPQETLIGGLAEDPAHYGDPVAKSVILTVHGMSFEYKDSDKDVTLPQVGKISLPLNFAGSEITVVRMDAPNMEPSITRNAYLGVDTTSTVPISGTVYALYSPHEGLVVKRLFLDSEGKKFILRSDAQNYPESTIDAKKLAGRILGRVVWVFQEL